MIREHTNFSFGTRRMLVYASKYTLEDVRDIMGRVYRIHEKDPNFPLTVIQKIKAFLENDELFTQPEKHENLVQEMKLEAALITKSFQACLSATVAATRNPTDTSQSKRGRCISQSLVARTINALSIACLSSATRDTS